MKLAERQRGLWNRISRRKLLIASTIVALSLLLTPTVHSIIYEKVYADTSTHNPAVYPSGFSGVVLPVKGGDLIVFKFRSETLFDVETRFISSTDFSECPCLVYGEERVANGQSVYHVPSDGEVEVSWRPSQVGPASFTYEVRIVPNLAGMSLLPIFPY